MIGKNLKTLLIGGATLFAAWALYETGAGGLGWSLFWSLGLSINGGIVFAVLQVVFPWANAAAFLILALATDAVGVPGAMAGAVSLAVALVLKRLERRVSQSDK